MPKTNTEWWYQKLMSNKNRDIENLNVLLALKWKVVLIWECGLKGKQAIPLQVIVDTVNEFMIDNNKLLCINSRGIELVNEVNEVYYE